MAWPVDSDWNPLYRSGGFVDDPEKDSATSRDIVGDTTFAAASLYNDGTYIYFRIRLDEDPRDNSLTSLDPFGWGFLIDTDGDTGDYEYMIMLDGIVNPEEIYLAENTVKTNLSDPSDKAETITWSQLLNNDPTSGNYRVLTSVDPGGPTTNFGGDPDFYIDYRMPYDVFKTTLGLNDNSLIRLFIGSSNSAQTLTADLGTTASAAYDGLLNDGISDEVLPNGNRPATGLLAFVADINGNGDVIEFYPGDKLYIRVDDADQNGIPTLRETITVIVTTPSGDSENLSLTETGVDTGIFTVAVVTSEGTITADDGSLQVAPIEFATASYIDAADADLDQFEIRSDSVKALPAADLALSKVVDIPTPNEGDTVTFTITLENYGPSTASSIQVTDQLPSGVTYVSNSSGGSYNPSTGIWSVAKLISSASVSLDIVATLDAGTTLSTITNIAAITAHAQPDPDASNDTASAAIAVTGADLALSLSADTLTPTNGGNVTLTLTATNNGSYDATGITINEIMNAADLVYVSHIASSGSFNQITGDWGEWTLGALPNGASETLQIVATVIAGSNTTVIQNAAITTADQSDPNSANNSANINLFINGTDLHLSKSVNDASPDVGDTITYTLLLENLGSNPATGIQTIDLLPSGVTYVSDNAPAGTSYDQFSGLWDFGATTLAGGATASLQIDTTIDSGTAAQTINNSASITAGPVDADTSNDTDSVDITVRYIDLEISKIVDDSTPQDGDLIVFTITVTNNGLIDATNVTIFDELPGQLAYTGSSATLGSYATATNLWTIGTVAVGATETLTVNCDVDIGNNDAPTFFNFASLQSADQEDPIDGNNTDSVLIGIAGTDISVAKSVDNNNPSTGDTITYSLVVINNGPNDATNLVISEVLPAGLTYVSDTDDYTAAQDQTSYNAGTGDWDIGHKSGGDTILPAYTTVNLTVTATATAASGTTLINTALVKNLDEAETDSTNNTSQVSITVGGANLAATLTVDNPTPTIGDTVTFTLSVTNNGPDTATSLQGSDLFLPAGLTSVSDSPTIGSYDPIAGTWGTFDLAVGATATLQFVATVDVGTGGLTLTQSATAASDTPDPDATSATTSVDLDVQEADVVLTKTADNATPEEGAPVVFTITVFNNGPTDTTNLRVSELLPVGLSYDTHVAEPGTSYDSASGLWDLSSLTIAKLGSATLTLTAIVDFGTAGSNITNSAGISTSGAFDGNISNNIEDAIITPFAPPPADLTIVKMASSASAQPGDIITYSLIIHNAGTGLARSVSIDDLMPSSFVALLIDPYGNGTPFFMQEGAPASGLTPAAATYLDSSGTPITLTSGGGGAPLGSDGRVAQWDLPFTGSMPRNRTFTLFYQVVIK